MYSSDILTDFSLIDIPPSQPTFWVFNPISIAFGVVKFHQSVFTGWATPTLKFRSVTPAPPPKPSKKLLVPSLALPSLLKINPRLQLPPRTSDHFFILSLLLSTPLCFLDRTNGDESKKLILAENYSIDHI